MAQIQFVQISLAGQNIFESTVEPGYSVRRIVGLANCAIKVLMFRRSTICVQRL